MYAAQAGIACTIAGATSSRKALSATIYSRIARPDLQQREASWATIIDLYMKHSTWLFIVQGYGAEYNCKVRKSKGLRKPLLKRGSGTLRALELPSAWCCYSASDNPGYAWLLSSRYIVTIKLYYNGYSWSTHAQTLRDSASSNSYPAIKLAPRPFK